MGSGEPSSVSGGDADFLVSGKAVFDWVSGARAKVYTVADPNVACVPSCGPFKLFPTDTGSVPVAPTPAPSPGGGGGEGLPSDAPPGLRLGGLNGGTAVDRGRRLEGNGDVLVGLALPTATDGRFFFVEHRKASTGGSAALVSWADVADAEVHARDR